MRLAAKEDGDDVDAWRSEGAIDLGGLLDASAWGGLQKAIVALAALAIIFDGMDIQMMGFAIPAMAKEWGVSRASFGPILAFGLIGVATGTALGGLLGDRIGRRISLMLSVLLFGSATFGIAFAHSLSVLFVLRMIAGLGIGGALPNATTLTAEFTPAKHRPVAVTLAIVCIPLGGVVAGLISSEVLVSGSWRTLFWIGGLAPIGLAFAFFAMLPESPRYLARHPPRRPELLKLLRRMGMALPAGSQFYEPAERKGIEKTAFAELLGKGNLGNTLCLWAAFFFCLITVYLVFNWLPTVLTGRGLGSRIASQGLAFYNFGGIFGALGFAWWISRRGSRMPLLAGSLAGLVTALLVRLVPIEREGGHGLLLAALAMHGLFVNAVQTTMYALAANMYATRVRATGVAAALAIGRLGAVTSAFLGASLLAYASNLYFLFLAIGMGCTFVALFGLERHIGRDDGGLAGS